MGALFRYPGGKTKLLKPIINQLAALSGNRQYREPFFGGGSVGIEMLKNCSNLWVNDKDIGICCLWTAVVRYPNDLIGLVEKFKPSVELFYAYKEDLLKLDLMPEDKEQIVGIGFKQLAAHQMSFSGLGVRAGGPMGGRTQASEKGGVGCRWSASRICKLILQRHEAFSKVNLHGNRCTNVDFEAMLSGSDWFAYLDPPYYVKGCELYQHGFSKVEHIRSRNPLRR